MRSWENEARKMQRDRRHGSVRGVVAVSWFQRHAGAQSQSFGSQPPLRIRQPKADIIFMHANVYTGVPANTAFSSILREEAIAVRGDRILAVGKNV